MNNNVIVIIDSGIDTKNELLNSHVVGGCTLSIKNQSVYVDSDFMDVNGHGTECADIMLQTCSTVMFYIIRIVSKEGKTSTKLLLKALELCTILDYKIINISLAVTKTQIKASLETVMQKLYRQNKFVFVSVRNGYTESYPAVLPTVIGVIGGNFFSDEIYFFDPTKKIQAIFDKSPKFTFTLNGRITIFRGNSKATALASASMLKKLTEGEKYECIEQIPPKVYKAPFFENQKSRDNDISYNKRTFQYPEIENMVKEAIEMTTRRKYKKGIDFEQNIFSKEIGITQENIIILLKKIFKILKITNVDLRSISIRKILKFGDLVYFVTENSSIGCRDIE